MAVKDVYKNVRAQNPIGLVSATLYFLSVFFGFIVAVPVGITLVSQGLLSPLSALIRQPRVGELPVRQVTQFTWVAQVDKLLISSSSLIVLIITYWFWSLSFDNSSFFVWDHICFSACQRRTDMIWLMIAMSWPSFVNCKYQQMKCLGVGVYWIWNACPSVYPSMIAGVCSVAHTVLDRFFSYLAQPELITSIRASVCRV